MGASCAMLENPPFRTGTPSKFPLRPTRREMGHVAHSIVPVGILRRTRGIRYNPPSASFFSWCWCIRTHIATVHRDPIAGAFLGRPAPPSGAFILPPGIIGPNPVTKFRVLTQQYRRQENDPKIPNLRRSPAEITRGQGSQPSDLQRGQSRISK